MGSYAVYAETFEFQFLQGNREMNAFLGRNYFDAFFK